MYNSFSFFFSLFFQSAPGVNPSDCPQNLLVETLRGTGGAIVTWKEPAPPGSIIKAPVTSGAFIPTGKSCVSYTYNNTFGVVEYCSFYVEVVEGKLKNGQVIVQCAHVI